MHRAVGSMPLPGQAQEVRELSPQQRGEARLNIHPRGIPTGYMNALESRLAETEKALFFALSELHSGVVVDGDYDSQPPHRSMLPQALSTAAPTHQLEKSDLMASWASQPLKNRAHAHAWLRSRQHHGPDALGPPAVNTTNGPHQTAPGPTVDSARNSKAKAFARENQELYF